jgi:PAS domain S-box-containing protein
MTGMPHTFPQSPNYGADHASTLALRLAYAEKAFLAFTSGQVDAIVDPKGETYLLRPAQEHLRQNARRLEALVDSIADVITVVNRAGTIVSQNIAVTRVLGYGPAELVGKNIFDFVHFEDRAHIHTAFLDVIDGMLEDATVLFRHGTPDGLFRTVEATVGKLGGPTSRSVVLSLRLVTACGPGGAEPDWHPGAGRCL